MTSAVYDNAAVHFGIGEINWTAGQTDVFATLCTGTYSPNKNTHAHYSDLTNQLAASGNYTTGGNLVYSAGTTLVTAALAANVCKFDSDDCTWANLTSSSTFEYTCVNHGALATAGNALITYHDMGTQQVTAGTLTLTWNANGIFTITVTAAS